MLALGRLLPTAIMMLECLRQACRVTIKITFEFKLLPTHLFVFTKTNSKGLVKLEFIEIICVRSRKIQLYLTPVAGSNLLWGKVSILIRLFAKKEDSKGKAFEVQV